MTKTHSNQPHRRAILIEYEASWSYIDGAAPLSRDPEAKPFGPGYRFRAGELLPSRGTVTPGQPKQVLYVPIARRDRVEHYPRMRIEVHLRQRCGLSNVPVPNWQGTKVVIEVRNIWPGDTQAVPLQLDGRLDDDLRCIIDVDAKTVQRWLDPHEPLKARVNENLLDFDFRIDRVGGKQGPARGQSHNRLFFYRRKVIVFLPGAFGSKLKVTTADGDTRGFPDWTKDGTTWVKWLAKYSIAAPEVGGYHAVNQEVGSLECDAQGEPLAVPYKPTLLSLFGTVYDIHDDLEGALRRRFSILPRGFALVELMPFAYDWRLDLTKMAMVLINTLKHLTDSRAVSSLARRIDTDDQVMLVGHSTGGLLIRRALAEPEAERLVGQACFINVPFCGAPKALSVILTGRDPPTGARMIPVVRPESIRAVALSMPIVYHLAPTEWHVPPVAAGTLGADTGSRGIEAQKEGLIEQAIASGFLPRPMFVKPGLPEKDRALVAAGADTWRAFWDDVHERWRSSQVYDVVGPEKVEWWYEAWLQRQIDEHGMRYQWERRQPGGWHAELAIDAQKFHRACEQLGTSGRWGDRMFVFYSTIDDETTHTVELRRTENRSYPQLAQLLGAEAIPMRDFTDGTATLERGEQEANGGSVIRYTQWQAEANPMRFQRSVWELGAQRTPIGGDGTVPKESQRAAGKGTTIFKPLPRDGKVDKKNPVGRPDGPNHKDAPKVDWLWDKLLDIIQGTVNKQDDCEDGDETGGEDQ